MKKSIFIISLLNLVLLFGCSPETETRTLGAEAQELELTKFAKENGYTIEKIPEGKVLYMANSIGELKKIMKNTESELSQPKYRSLGDSKTEKKLSEKEIDKLLNTHLESFKKKGKTITNKSQEDIDPPYKYTITTSFDNPFPASNVYVTINYNTNSNGQIISAEAHAGSYGFSMGGYTQTNYVGTVQNGIFVFQITGQLTASNAIGGFLLSNQGTVTHFGYFQKSQGGGVGFGGGGSDNGWIRQSSTDQTVEAYN